MLRLLTRALPLLAILGTVAAGAIALRQSAPAAVHLRRIAVWELSRVARRRVHLKEVALSLHAARARADHGPEPLRVRLAARGLVIEQAAPLSGAAAEAPAVSAEMDAAALLTGKPFLSTVRLITVTRPRVVLLRDRSGEWNITDLLTRKPKRPTRFAARIEVADGRVSISDYSPPQGMAVPQTALLEPVDARVSSPMPGRWQFRLWARDTQGRFSRLSVAGQWLRPSEPGRSDGRVSGSVEATGVDIGYAWRYRVFAPALHIARGRADIQGYFALQPRVGQGPLFDYGITADSRSTDMALPWIASAAHNAVGRLRVSNGVLQLVGVRATVAGADVTGHGFVEVADDAHAASADSAPPDDHTPPMHPYALEFRVSAAPGFALARLAPAGAEDAIKGWRGSSSGSIALIGGGGETTLFGDLSVPGWAIGRTRWGGEIARAAGGLEVRRLQGRFVYADKNLAAVARGDLAGGAVTAALVVPTTGRGRFGANVAGVSLSSLSLSGDRAAVSGQAWAQLQGGFAVGRGAARTRPVVTGQFALLNGRVVGGTDEHRVSLPVATAVGAGDYSGGSVLLSRAVVAADYGTLHLAGSLAPSGAVAATLRGNSIDLARLGERVGVPLEGVGFGSVLVSGTLASPTVQARGDVFAGSYSGHGFDWIGAEAMLQGVRVPHFSAVLHRGGGSATVSGSAELATAGRPGRLAATGRVEKVQVRDWLPADLREQVSGVLDAEVALRGSPGAPEAEASFTVSRPWAGGMQFDVAEGKARYADGRYSLPSFIARVNGAQLAVAGALHGGERLAFDVRADRLRLGQLVRGTAVPDLDGLLSLRGTLTGTISAPRGRASIQAEELTLGRRPLGDVTGGLVWTGDRLELHDVDCAARSGHLRLSGALAQPRAASPTDAQAWNANLQADIEGLPVALLLDLLERGAAGAGGDSAAAFSQALTRLPRPITGFLTASAAIRGSLARPTGDVSFALSDAALAGQTLPSLGGQFTFAGSRLDITSLAARDGDADAQASGVVDLKGDTSLDVEIHNLGAEVLRPWVRQVSNLSGSADVFLRLRGPTNAPSIRGDMEVANPKIADIELERLKVDRFSYDAGRIEVENVRVVKGAHRARASASIPFDPVRRELAGDAPLSAEVVLEGQDLSFVSALWPAIGELAGPLDVDLVVGGTAARPRLESGFLRAGGAWTQGDERVQLALNGEVVDQLLRLQSPTGAPGIVVSSARSLRGASGARGTVSASGVYDPFAGPVSRWGLGKYEVALQAEDVRVSLGGIFTGKVGADLLLRGDPAAEEVDSISGQATVESANVSPPQQALGPEFSWKPVFSPAVDVGVTVAGARVTAATARLEDFSGHGRLGGRLGYEPLAVDMRLTSHRGSIDFPTTSAEIRTVVADITKAPEGPIRIAGRVDADARVGQYRVTLAGAGELYPTSTLQIVATTTPPLSQTQATALLLGLPPNLLPPGEAAPGEALGQQVTQSFSSNVVSIASLGLSLPLLRALRLSELSFSLSPIATRVQVGKRVTDQLYLSYLSTTNGTERTSRTRLMYQLTPRIAVGGSIDERQLLRYEVESSVLF